MELRQLTTDHERQVFAECLAKARAMGGVAAKETVRSRLGAAHLTFGRVYGIFEHEGEPPQRMLAGFIVHDLATLPQSFPRPDVSHLPAKSVIEGGELWSLSKGAAGIAKRVAPAIAGLLQAKAILLYPVVKPIDLTGPHAQLNFVKAGEPLRNPYGETLDGGEVWVQPMILEGAALDEYIRRGFEFLFQVDGKRQVLRFDVSLMKSATATEPAAPHRREVQVSGTTRPDLGPQAGNGMGTSMG
jgi:hypothetical protein